VARRTRRANRRRCWIEPTRGGLLRLRFRWCLPAQSGLHKFSETTDLQDTPENRSLLAREAAIIGAEIRAETFDYPRWFPNGSRAGFFGRPASSLVSINAKTVTISEYYQAWVLRKVPPMVRPSRSRDYRNHFRTYVLPFVGDVELVELSLEHLEDLRARLQVERRLCLKTV